ncbi:hypothetical protein D3C73_1528280 [compost metagenome]
MCLLVRGEGRIPVLLGFFAFFPRVPGPINLFGDVKGGMMPAQILAGQRHFFFTQCRAVRLFFPGLIRRAKANYRPADNE